MHRFIDGEDRMQQTLLQTLLPNSLVDYVSEENPVRVIEVFIDELDLAALGFAGMTPAATGRPAYHPSTPLKIYLYGYLNRVQSSRRLEITVLADRGYFSGDQVLSCEGTGVAPIVPKTLTSSGAKRGFFTRQDFIYDAERDHYTCPEGAKLTKAKRRADHTEDFDFYRHLSACFTCPPKSRCTPTKLRRIKRWENEDVLDRMQDRLDRMPDAMGVRRQTVEHPFGTLKAWMGATHFLTRTLDKVRTEMSLHVLAYNLKRMIRIF